MKRSLSLFPALAALVFSIASSAAEVPFDQAQFDAALAAGKPVVVDFSAGWCPVCRAQKPVLSAILQTPEMANLTLFVANFDTEKTLKKALRINQQSTLVVFKNGKEVTRSTGQTQQEPLRVVLAQAL
jgi:thiol-disulfide isomerase/thioredoxin